MRIADLFAKSGILAAFFYCLLLPATAVGAVSASSVLVQSLDALAQEQRLHESTAWHSLLHASETRAYLRDPSFLLSLPHFTPEAELTRTIEFLYDGPSSNVCRFPARYHFLRNHLDAPPLPLEGCPDVVEFRSKAPAEHISLVFASENLAQPASMMGHTFLKISGRDKTGKELSHAISFYTETGTVNVPKLLYDSTVKGKPGYFTLSPYHEKLEQYINDEQRSVWEYHLQLSEMDKELLLLHLLELKQANFTYFFQDYNCATLVYFILGTTSERLKHDGYWVTPRDVVKHASNAGLVQHTDVLTPDRWVIRALAQQLPASTLRETGNQVLRGLSPDAWSDSRDNTAFLRLMLAETDNDYAFRQGQLARSVWSQNREVLAQIRQRDFPHAQLEAGDDRNPLFAPPDKQLSFGLASVEGLPEMRINFLPVSHFITDDNRRYFNENELLLFETEAHVSRRGTLSLDHLTIYGIQALTPFDPLTGGISGKFRIGIEQQRDAQLRKRRAAYISGAIGLTGRFAGDIDTFALVGGGLAYALNGYGYVDIEIGMLVREVFNMKSMLTYDRTAGQIDTGARYDTLRFTQSKFLDRMQTIQLEFSQTRNRRAHENSAALIYKRLF